MSVQGLNEFLINNPLMCLEPLCSDAGLVVSGKVELNHQYENYPQITCWISLNIKIPARYPMELPIIEETGGAIPKSGDFHVNPDGTLCLGSPFRLYVELSDCQCFNAFYNRFFIPYAYAALLKLKHNIGFIFGELSHGNEGEVEDFCDFFGVEDKYSVASCLKVLSQKKRIANKRICPCGCGHRLGVCKLHYTINRYRNIIPRNQFYKTAQKL